MNQHQEQRSSSINNVLGLKAFDHHLVECAIWDLMADFKKRDIHEICLAIKLQGYCGVAVDKRCKVLFARKWFDRSSERGGSPYYTLKKSVKRPMTKEELQTAIEAKNASKWPASTVGFLATALNGIAVEKEVVNAKHLLPLFSRTLPIFELPASKPEPVIQKPMKAPINMSLLPSDPIQVAIWKITSDQRPYTVQRLCEVMPDVPLATIYSNLVKMAKNDMLIVNRLGNNVTKTYTLKPGTPMPVGLKPYDRAIAPPSIQKKEEPTMKTLDVISLLVPLALAADAAAVKPSQDTFDDCDLKHRDIPTEPLLDFSIRIKGSPVTMQEAQTIATELMDAGFGDLETDLPPQRYKLIELTIRVAGVQLTAQEAHSLAQQLIRNNFHG